MSGFRELRDEVLAATSPFVRVETKHIDDLKQRASRSPLHRARILAHGDPGATLHEMLIVQSRPVYVRPHKHLGKPESLHVIEGSALVIYFNEQGEIEELLEVGPAGSGSPFFLRCGTPRFHMQIVLTDFFVFHEVTSGPFLEQDTVFAPWAPDETDRAAVELYLASLRARPGFPSCDSPGGEN